MFDQIKPLPGLSEQSAEPREDDARDVPCLALRERTSVSLQRPPGKRDSLWLSNIILSRCRRQCLCLDGPTVSADGRRLTFGECRAIRAHCFQ
jgi:hypothetical protein